MKIKTVETNVRNKYPIASQILVQSMDRYVQQKQLKSLMDQNQAVLPAPQKQQNPINNQVNLEDLQKIKEEEKKRILEKQEDKKLQDINSFETEVEATSSCTEPSGGYALPRTASDTDYAPQKGDRQDRLKQSKNGRLFQSGCIYDWTPSWIQSELRTVAVDGSTAIREAILRFKWDSEGLNNLVIDSNEAVEAEITFYNYGTDPGIPGSGRAWMYSTTYWETNVPSGYQDTRFLDPTGEVNYAVGTRYPQNLVANVNYYFKVQGIPQVTEPNGLYKINVQRGYYYDHLYIESSADEWNFFSEEFETTLVPKQFHKYDSAYWAPNGFQHTFINSGYLQFRYRNSSTIDAALSSEYLSTSMNGHNHVRRIQVDENGTNYKIKTRYGSSSSDTVIEDYDQRYNLIGYNDDYNGTLYSQLDLNLNKGNYYIVIKGYNDSIFNAYFDVVKNYTQAEPIQLGQTKYVSLSTNQDKWFSFVSPGTAYYLIGTAKWQTDSDTMIYLYDENQNYITHDDDSGPDLYSQIITELQGGKKYYVQIRGYNWSAMDAQFFIGN